MKASVELSQAGALPLLSKGQSFPPGQTFGRICEALLYEDCLNVKFITDAAGGVPSLCHHMAGKLSLKSHTASTIFVFIFFKGSLNTLEIY